MNIITGYLAPTAGEVKINGHDIQREPEEAKQCIGYLPEMPPVYQDMTVKEYLRFVAELKRVPSSDREDQVEEVMKMTRIMDMGDRLIKNLSKGYKQRAGLAQALLGKPEILILDEPTVGLDPKQIIEIRDLIRSLREKHTIILSSHILSEVSAVCDQILIISAGKLVACDTPEGLTRRMTGEEEITFTVKGDAQKLKKVLGGMEKILEFQVHKVTEEKTGAVVKTEVDTDIRETLFYLLAENKLPLLELRVTTKSLEDIFLELTDSERNFTKDDGKEKKRKRISFRIPKRAEEEEEGTEESAGAEPAGENGEDAQ